nr:NADH dehydrogenase subunit 6 [Labrisomus nuchipinnis]
MSYIILAFLVGLIFGVGSAASNPSPYYAALGLVVAAGMACGVLLGHGASFLALVLFLIYLGGMLVVFAYSAALAAEPYPEGRGVWPLWVAGLGYLGACAVGGVLLWTGDYGMPGVNAEEYGVLSVYRSDTAGVAVMYSSGGWMLTVGVLVLAVALFAVFELVRGKSRGSLRTP